MSLTQASESLIVRLAQALDISRERYESADRSYRSLARWLNRVGSRFENIETSVYTQGSFRLGTAIRPLTGEEHYDLDVVCEFDTNKFSLTQQKLQSDLGHEIKAYANAYGMDSPDCWDRCWTLNYDDSAQFHMDVLPCLPDGQSVRSLSASANLYNPFADSAIAITDRKHRNYPVLSQDWPTSNPNGYAEWFLGRMRPILRKRKGVGTIMAAEAEVADIPRFEEKTPLQSAIQILKRHRDVMFAEDDDHLKPTSIIVTTLAAHAYRQEEAITDALYGILERMLDGVQYTDGEIAISNPSDPRENFADSWRGRPDKRRAFFEWVDAVRSDFSEASQLFDMNSLVKTLAPRLGRELIEFAASEDTTPTLATDRIRSGPSLGLDKVLAAPHRKRIEWPTVLTRRAYFSSAIASTFGFRNRKLENDGVPVRKGTALHFTVSTDVHAPFQVFWQIVNTGNAATEARDLRGTFEEGRLELGHLSKSESARYPGVHSVECFIVKDGVCVARTAPLVVNIR